MAEFIIGSPSRKLAREHRFLWQLLWRLDYLLAWTLVKMAGVLPLDAASRFGQHVGTWVGARLSRKTAIFKENMRIAFPELGEEERALLVQRPWGRAGRVMAEYPHLDRILSEPDRLLIDIREPIVTYDNPEQPCVVVTAHPSNWEVVCSAMAAMGIPDASLYSPPTNPLLDKLLHEHRRVDQGKPIRFFGRDKLSTMIRPQPEDWFCSKRIWSKTTNIEQTEEAGSEADTDSYAV